MENWTFDIPMKPHRLPSEFRNVNKGSNLALWMIESMEYWAHNST